MNLWPIIYLIFIILVVFVVGFFLEKFFGKKIDIWREEHEKSRPNQESTKADKKFKIAKADLQKFKNNLKDSNNGRKSR